ncbi:hypothetical protein J5U18_12655 [Sphingobacteriaceae bacterium WQ 2009]|uniref:Uncharacterized protein n=1 Tax=Rhinopithecimicrobium faecis TaxID=2820698 RepID=A0A8T4HIB2_9SPHI|nr:hypothetical protein [Sphingobacteriaceae bacterium WQ 2009]
MNNYKISKDDILRETNGGLDIIRFYVPEIDQFAGTRKKFKLHDEKTPSASIKQLADGNYVVADFGDDGKWLNGIALAQKMERLEYGETIKLLAQRFGIANAEQVESMFQPTFKTDNAAPDQADGTWIFNPIEIVPESHLRILFADKIFTRIDYDKRDIKDANERKEAVLSHLRSVLIEQHWHGLTSYTIIKNRKAITITAAEYYPIYRIEESVKGPGDQLKVFSKIYQPKAKEKKNRFFYHGDFDPQFLHGLMQFKKAFDTMLKDCPEDESGEPLKNPKLKEVIYCTGGSDALNFRALGYHTIYPSSEYFKLSNTTLKSLFAKAERVLTCPDLDITGQKQNHKLCMDSTGDLFLDICTIELPEELQEKRDQYGRPCKDLRDYLGHYSSFDLLNIVKVAKMYRFWDYHQATDKDGNAKIKFGRPVYEYKLSSERVLNFLKRCGFGRHKVSEETTEFVHMDSNTVKVVKPEDVKGFLIEFLRKRYMPEELINVLHRSPLLNEASFAQLPVLELDFTDHDRDAQYMFFKNATWRIDASGVKQLKPADVDRMVWASKILPHSVQQMDNMFTVTKNEEGRYDIEIKNHDCLFFKFLTQTSRVHWRKELEENLVHLPLEERKKYIEANKFNIAGPNLTPEQQYEQKLHLINKMYAFGYLMHRYKSTSRPWIVMPMDDTPNKDGGSHGGTGKSIFFTGLYQIKNVLKLDGKNDKLFEDSHVFEQVNKNTDIIYIDDASRNFPMERTFSMTTGAITVNPKGKTRTTIEFNDSPKMGLTTNFAPDDLSPSTLRRILFIGMSNYYHVDKMGEFNENRQPKDDFGKELFNEFNAAEWNTTLNFMAQCCSLFLNYNDMIEAPMANIMQRNLTNNMGVNFLEWAETYFSEDSGRLDILVPAAIAQNDYLRDMGIKSITSQGFNNKMKLYALMKNYVLAPKEVLNPDGRVTRFSEAIEYDSRTKRWFKSGGSKTQTMIYLQTKNNPVDRETIFDPTLIYEELPTPVAGTTAPNF